MKERKKKREDVYSDCTLESHDSGRMLEWFRGPRVEQTKDRTRESKLKTHTHTQKHTNTHTETHTHIYTEHNIHLFPHASSHTHTHRHTNTYTHTHPSAVSLSHWML